jgi:hypothetical protein
MDTSPKSILLVAGTGVISYSMTILQSDHVEAILMLIAGAGIFFLREWLKQ